MHLYAGVVQTRVLESWYVLKIAKRSVIADSIHVCLAL